MENEIRHEVRSVVRGAQQVLRRLEGLGVRKIPRAGGLRQPSIGKKEEIAPVREKALVCKECRLSQGRTHVVFGEGCLDAELVFVGEGPGQEEDRLGRPFVGAAGKLLTKIIEAMNLTRDQVYIANVVKCRPPLNRPPQPDEKEACFPYLRSQLQIIRPRVICALGRTAASALLHTDFPLSELRGKALQWEGIPVVVTFHPAYLLRNPADKKLVWQDMKRVKSYLT